jgi:hypothetical protein
MTSLLAIGGRVNSSLPARFQPNMSGERAIPDSVHPGIFML